MIDFKWLQRSLVIIFTLFTLLACSEDKQESEDVSDNENVAGEEVIPIVPLEEAIIDPVEIYPPELKSINIQTANSPSEGDANFSEGDSIVSSTLSLGINADVNVVQDGSEVYEDALHFSYFEIDTDYQLVVKINSLSASKRKSKVGLMVRSGLSNDSNFAAVLLNDIGKIQFSSREKSGNKGLQVDVTTEATPLWLKLTRRGPYVVSYYSQDNINWQFVGENSIASTQTAYIGITAFSGELSAVVEANLASLSLTKLPRFDINGGVHLTPVDVTLQNRRSEADYYYTLDGTQPDKNSLPFTDNVMIDEDAALTVSEYVDDVLQDTLSAYFVIKDSAENIYYRPLHFSYGGVGGDKRLSQSNAEILNTLITAFPNKPTLLTPVILNEDPALFEPFISQVKQIVPSIYFGVGFAGRHSTPTEFPKDYDQVIALAKKFRVYSDAIRIEAFDNIVDISGDASMDGEAYMVKLLEALHDLGFTQIMANPWVPRPYDEDSGESYQQWPHLTSVFIGTGSVEWGAPIGRINKVHQYNPSLNILVNYENAPRHIELSDIEQAYQKGESTTGSIDIMQDLVDRQLLKDTLKENDLEIQGYFKWSAPWSQNYDPLALGTVEWIGETSTELNP